MLKFRYLEIQKRLNFLFDSQIKNEKEKRKYIILTLVLLGLISFIIVFILTLWLKVIIFNQPSNIDLIRNSIYLIFFLSYLFFLLFLSKKIKLKFSIYLLLFSLFILLIRMILVWKIELPLTILFIILAILLTSILISPCFSFFTTAISSLVFFILSILKSRGLTCQDLIYKTNSIFLKNLIIYIIFFLFFALICWSLNKETEKKMEKCCQLKKDLESEKNLLRIKIEQVTNELKDAQQNEVKHLAQLANFGKLSGGFFHELANPLTAISLNMEEVNIACQQNPVWSKFANNVDRSVKAAKKMGCFLSSIRKQIAKKDEKTSFSLNDEIEEVLEILEQKSKKNLVSLIFKSDKNIFLFNSQIKFHQLAINLISNAIDSYSNKKEIHRSKIVTISLFDNKTGIVFSVRDRGCGISKDVQEKMFKPFFTTKCLCNNSGLGLSLVNSIVKQDFKGKIKIESKKNKGSKFIIFLPK